MSDAPTSLLVLNALPLQPQQLDLVSATVERVNFESVLNQEVLQTHAIAPPVLPLPIDNSLESLIFHDVPRVSFSVAVAPSAQKPSQPLPEIVADELLKPDTSSQATAVGTFVRPTLALQTEAIQHAIKSPTIVPTVLPTTGKPLPAPVTLNRSPTLVQRIDVREVPTPLYQAGPTRATEVPLGQDFPRDTIDFDSDLQNFLRLPTSPGPVASGPELRAGVELTQLAPPQQVDSKVPIAAVKTALVSSPTPQQQQAWQTDFTQQVVWIGENKVSTARIRLNPPELGFVEVRVSMTQDQASISFTAASPEVRSAIESAMPRLHNLLQGNGIDLGNTNVEQQSHSESQTQQHQSGQPQNKELETFDAKAEVLELPSSDSQLVDVFI